MTVVAAGRRWGGRRWAGTGVQRPRGCHARQRLARGPRDHAELSGESPDPRLLVSDRDGVTSNSPVGRSPRRECVADGDHQPAEREQKQGERDDREQCAVRPGREAAEQLSGGRVGMSDGAARCGPPTRGVAVRAGEALGSVRSRTVGRSVVVDEDYEPATAATRTIGPRRLTRLRLRQGVEIGVRLDEQVPRHWAVSPRGWYRRFGQSRRLLGSRGSQIEYRPEVPLVPFRTVQRPVPRS